MKIPTRTRHPMARLALVVVMVAALWAVGSWAGMSDTLTQDRVKDLVTDAGVWGVAVFVGAFVAGQMMHLPGLIFIAAATFAWGPLAGALVSTLGATVAVSVNFALVRRIGGGALAELRRPVIERMIRSLHRRPRLTMLVARSVFVTAPLLTTMLALSGVRSRDHALTSGLGMLPLIVAWSFVLDAAVF